MSSPGADPWGVAGGQTAPQGEPPPQPWIPSEDEAHEALTGVAPGATPTSGYRTPQHNLDVGGVPDSMHTRGQAMDFVLPKGADPDQVRASLVKQGYPVTEWLNEGNHIHWGWGPKGNQPLPADDPWAPAGPQADPWAPAKPLSPTPALRTVDVQPEPAKPEGSWADVLAPNLSNAWMRWKADVASFLLAGAETPPELMPRSIQATEFTPPPVETAQDRQDRSKVAKWALETRNNLMADIKANSPNLDPGSVKSIAYSLGTSLTDLVPAIAASYVNPLLGAGYIGLQSGSRAYGEAREQGRTADQARMDGIFTGLVNGAAGQMKLGLLQRSGGSFLGRTFANAGEFGAISVIQEAVQIGYDKGLVDPNMTFSQAWERLKQAGIVGALTGGILGAGHAGLDAARARFQSAPSRSLAETRTEPSASNPPGPKGPPPGGAGPTMPEQNAVPAMLQRTGVKPPGAPQVAPSGEPPVQSARKTTEVPQEGGWSHYYSRDGSVTIAPSSGSIDPWGTERPPEAQPVPKPRINAHTIQQEHEDEVTRLETQAIVAASQPRGGTGPEVSPEEAEAARQKLETQRNSRLTPQEPLEAAAHPNEQGIPTRHVESDLAYTPSGREVPVNYAVVEAAHLVPSQTQDGAINPHYPQELQPRDRTRAVSQNQVAQIAQNMNPRLLDRSPNAGDGAPIIAPSGVVESGNGRTLAIQRAYSNDLPTARAYREYLKAQGYPVDDMVAPVLVRVRSGEMTPDERQAFVREANQPSQLGMSATERAMSDAAATPDHVLDDYRGGDVELAANRPFVRRFLESVVPENERAQMIGKDGSLSQDAVRRVRSALLAKAYGDPGLVNAIVESPDNEIKAIGGALMDSAGAWSKMRARAAAGEIPPGFDQTQRLLEAVHLVGLARQEGRNVAEYVSQPDIFSGETISPETKAWLSLMFRDTASWTKPVGRDRLSDALNFYAGEALKVQPTKSMFGGEPLAGGEVLDMTRRRLEKSYERATGKTAPLPLGQGPREGGEPGAGPGVPGAKGAGGERAQGQRLEPEEPKFDVPEPPVNPTNGKPLTHEPLFSHLKIIRELGRQGDVESLRDALDFHTEPNMPPLVAGEQSALAATYAREVLSAVEAQQKPTYKTEPGAVDAKGKPLPQMIIPGAEQSVKQLAVAREGRIKTKAAQKEAGPLFAPGEGAAGGKQGSLFQVAYHGSTHDFERFENEAIGTGEGHAAYGHGHYFAGNKAVAQYYRDQLAGNAYPSPEELAQYFKPGRVIRGYGGHERVIKFYPSGSEYGGGWHVLVQGVEKNARGEWLDKPGDVRDHQTAPNNHDIVESYKADGLPVPAKGKLYHVELAPKEDEWLDLDKPMSEQSAKVKAALARVKDSIGIDTSDMRDLGEFGGQKIEGAPETGQTFIRRLARAVGGKEAASEVLRRAGIPGNRYHDQDSRLAAARAVTELPQKEAELAAQKKHVDDFEASVGGRPYEYGRAVVRRLEGEIEDLKAKAAGATHNYVVFDPEHIEIKAKEQQGVGGNYLAAVHRERDAFQALSHDVRHIPIGPASPAEQRVIDAVTALAKRIVPGAVVTGARRLEPTVKTSALGQDLTGRAFGGVTYTPLNGARRAIAWSLESPNAPGSLRHEAIHWLRDQGAIRPSEWDALERDAVKQDWMGKHNIAQRYAGLPRHEQMEEAVAEQISRWRTAPKWIPESLRPVVTRVLQTLGAIKDFIRSAYGAKTNSDDVFNRILSGEVGARVRPIQEPAGPRPFGRAMHQAPEEPERRGGIMGPIDHALGRAADHIGTTVSGMLSRMPNALHTLGEAAKMGVAPMAAGWPRYRAWAKEYATTGRQVDHEAEQVDRYLTNNFTPEQRKKMYLAMETESIAKRTRGTVPAGEGFASLSETERGAVRDLEARNISAARAGFEHGVLPTRIEHYVPRMGVVMFGGQATRARGAGGSGGDTIGGRIGRNLRTTTPQLKGRKYLSLPETEAAFQERFGEGGEIVKDIRTLNLATRNLWHAINGRALIGRIKDDGAATGQDTVVEGGAPNPREYFTIPEHNSFVAWRPDFTRNEETGKLEPKVDQNGQTVFKATPLYVTKDAEGPLRAVLSRDQNRVYKALLDLKARQMSVIMYSPFMHNQVIWGRAFPVAPLKLLTPVVYRGTDGNMRFGIQLYVDGFNAKNDTATMNEAIQHGLDPIGRNYQLKDVTGIVNDPNIAPGRSWTSQIIAAIPGFFDKEAGESVKRAIDDVGDFVHNRMLWDQVASLQMGLYTLLRDSAIRGGHDEEAAKYYAAHFANRYAGAMPIEALSKGARAFANMLLFSRSFTLGTAAAFKDTLVGLPRDVQARILETAAPEALQKIQGTARRKAATLILADMLVNKLSLVLGAGAVAMAHYALTGQWMPQWPWNNEPNRENRIAVGAKPDGTVVYMRLPVGKTGEDLYDWATEPREVLLRKLSPMSRLAYSVAANDKGWGRHFFNEEDRSLGSWGKTVDGVAGQVADSFLPYGQVQFMQDMITGNAKLENAGRAVLPALGFTMSSGAPGGPAMGLLHRAKAEYEQRLQDALPTIMSKMRSGDIAGGRKIMQGLGVPLKLQEYFQRAALHGGRLSPRAMRDFVHYAPPEEQAEMKRLLQQGR